MDCIWEVQFFEEDGGFLTVWGAGGVEVYFCLGAGHFWDGWLSFRMFGCRIVESVHLSVDVSDRCHMMSITST